MYSRSRDVTQCYSACLAHEALDSIPGAMKSKYIVVMTVNIGHIFSKCAIKPHCFNGYHQSVFFTFLNCYIYFRPLSPDILANFMYHVLHIYLARTDFIRFVVLWCCGSNPGQALYC